MTRTTRSAATTYALVALGVVAIVVAALHLGLPDPDVSIRNHHIQHAFFVLGGALLGVALARGRARPAAGAGHGANAWLLPAIAAPLAIMFAMWPSSYEYIEERPLLHMAEHGVFIVLAAITTFAGWRFSRGTGWLLGGMATAMAWAAAFGFGVTPPPVTLPASTLAVATPTATSPGGASPAGAQPVDGATVYQNCVPCHQAQGTGLPGAFPPLAGHLPQLLAAPGGREYVEHVLLYGLQGSITVAGRTYDGVMPAWGHLGDDELAAVLDYVAGSWGNALPAGQQPVTAAEFAAARVKQLTPQEVHALRQGLDLP